MSRIALIISGNFEVIGHPQNLLRRDVADICDKCLWNSLRGTDCCSGVDPWIFKIIEVNSCIDKRRYVEVDRDCVLLPSALAVHRRAVRLCCHIAENSVTSLSTW